MQQVRPPTILRPGRAALAVAVLVAAGALASRRGGPRPAGSADGAGGLVVLGPASVRVEHGDRGRPCAHVFRIFNPTPRPIVIRGVATSCSCSVAAPIEGELGPGRERPLALRVNRFDPYETDFSTTATVETDAGPLEVRLAGTVPPSSKVRCRPQVLYLKPEALTRSREQFVVLRVPRPCARDAGARSIRVIGGPAEVRWVSERRDGPHYLELTAAVRFPAPGPGERPTWDRIEADAGCEPVAIPVVVLGAG